MLDEYRRYRLREEILDNSFEIMCCGCLVAAFVVATLMLWASTKPRDNTIYVSRLTPITPEENILRGSHIMSRDEYEAFAASGISVYETYEDYASKAGAQSSSFIDEYSHVNVDDVNQHMYDLCDQYFNVYYGTTRVSPILPMALANQESGNRADFKKCWTALFPSRYADISLIDSYDARTAMMQSYTLEDARDIYAGPLQMTGVYGTQNRELNALMSGSEKSKVSGLDILSQWSKRASSEPGDRYYVPDMLLRLQSALSTVLQKTVTNQYNIENEQQLLAILAISHNSGSGVFSTTNKNKKIGNWKSASKAYEWTEIITSQEMIDAIKQRVATSNDICILRADSIKLVASVYPDLDYRDYTSSQINAYYPVNTLYNYYKLQQLYTGQ